MRLIWFVETRTFASPKIVSQFVAKMCETENQSWNLKDIDAFKRIEDQKSDDAEHNLTTQENGFWHGLRLHVITGYDTTLGEIKCIDKAIERERKKQSSSRSNQIEMHSTKKDDFDFVH